MATREPFDLNFELYPLFFQFIFLGWRKNLCAEAAFVNKEAPIKSRHGGRISHVIYDKDMDSPLPFGGSKSSASRYVLVVGPSDAIIQSPEDEIRHINQSNTETIINSIEPPILCHAPSVCRRLDVKKFEALDLLELFAVCIFIFFMIN